MDRIHIHMCYTNKAKIHLRWFVSHDLDLSQEQNKVSPSVIREFHSRDSDSCRVSNGEVYSSDDLSRDHEHGRQQNVKTDNSVGDLHGNFQSSRYFGARESTCSFPFNSQAQPQSQSFNSFGNTGRVDDKFSQFEHDNDVKWRSDVVTSTENHMTCDDRMEFDRGSGKGNVVSGQINRDFLPNLDLNKQNIDGIWTLHNQTSMSETPLKWKTPDTNIKFVTGASSNVNKVCFVEDRNTSGNFREVPMQKELFTPQVQNSNLTNQINILGQEGTSTENNQSFQNRITGSNSSTHQMTGSPYFSMPKQTVPQFQCGDGSNTTHRDQFNYPNSGPTNVDAQHNFKNSQGNPFIGQTQNFSNFGQGAENYSAFQNSQKLQRKFRKQKDPDTYDGKNVEWPDYICHFEQVGLWNGWSENEMAAQLAMCLRGSAQRVLSEISREELFNYEKLKFSLTQRFCPPERETAYRCEFRNRRRKKEESVTEYGYALKRLAAHAFPSIPLKIRESFIIEQYISGLSDPALKRHIQFSHPNSLDRAISLALEFEAFEGSQITPRKPKNDDDFSAICSPVKVEKKGDDSSQNSLFKKLIEGMQDIQKSMTTMLQNQNKKGTFIRGNIRSNRENGTGRRKVQCFYCKQDGHMKMDCPVLKDSEFNQIQKQSGNFTAVKSDSVDLN